MENLNKRLIFSDPSPVLDVEKEDVARIVRICADRGYSISPEEALGAWEAYSQDYFASFLELDIDDNLIFDNVKSKCEEVTA